MKILILHFLHFQKIWYFPILKIVILQKNLNKFVNFKPKVQLLDYLLAKDWYQEFQFCDVYSVTLTKQQNIGNIRQLAL